MSWQPLAILYPDVELTVASALPALLFAYGETGVWVGRSLPKKRPDRAIQVIRDGGNSANLRDVARVRVLVWDTTEKRATDLASVVVALMPRLVGSGDVLKTAHLSGPYQIEDVAPKRYLLFEIHTRGEELQP